MNGRTSTRRAARRVVTLVAVLAFARVAAGQNPAAGQTADDYRGGWRTDSGEAHTYEFSIRGATVRGIYCTYCADATTLAFVDGTFGPEGIRFEVTHVNADGSTGIHGQGDREVQPGPPDRDGHERCARWQQVRARADQGSARTGSDTGDGVTSSRSVRRSRQTLFVEIPTVQTACPTFSRDRGNHS